MDQQPQQPQLQPQPPQQPVQVPPVAPVQPELQPVVQTPPPAPKKSNKAAIIISVISLVFIALVVLIISLFAFRTTISADDYKQASTDSAALQASYEKVYAQVSDKLPEMVIRYQARTDDPTVEELKTLFQDYSQKSDAFLKLNALKDKNIKEEHKQFFEKNDQFIVFMNGFFDSVAALKKEDACATAQMTNYTHKTALTVFDKAYGPCFAAIDELINSKNTVIAKYNTAIKKNLTELRDLHKDIQDAALAGDTRAQMEASNKIMSLNPEAATKSADEAVLDGVDALDMASQLKSLQEALKSKAQSTKS